MEIPLPEVSSKRRLYFMHRPEVEQSVIPAGYTLPPYEVRFQIAKRAPINILGVIFTSGINLNLREGQSIGLMGLVLSLKNPSEHGHSSPIPVQIDKTKESIEEIIKEFNWITGENPSLRKNLIRRK